MERDDANQEGITLTPNEQTRLLAEAAARQVVIEHLNLCPFAKDNVGQRLRTLEISFGRLIGFMIGSGLLGGLTANALSTFLKP